MTKALVFFLVIVVISQLLLSVSLVNSIRTQATVKRFYKSHHSKVKQNFSTSIKIIDLAHLKVTLLSSSPSSMPTRQTTVTTSSAVKSANLVIKKRKKIKLKRKKLQRIDGTILNGNFELL